MYIGNTVITQGFTPQVDFFSGNASTTAFTLSRPVASTYQMIVVVANVTQNPGSAYTVTGNTITFASAPPSGTNNIWVEYTSLITQTIAPSQGTVGTSQLQSNLALTGATNSGQWTAANMPTGSVVQVVTGSYASVVSSSSTGYVTTSFSASITPQFSSSKVFAIFNLSGCRADTGGSGSQFTIYRNNTTNLGSGGTTFNCLGFNQGASGGMPLYNSIFMQYLDSPSTTSSTTYTAYMATGSGGGTVAINIVGTSIVTLLEIR